MQDSSCSLFYGCWNIDGNLVGQPTNTRPPTAVATRLNSHQTSSMVCTKSLLSEWHQICCRDQVPVAPILPLIALIPIDCQRFAADTFQLAFLSLLTYIYLYCTIWLVKLPSQIILDHHSIGRRLLLAKIPGFNSMMYKLVVHTNRSTINNSPVVLSYIRMYDFILFILYILLIGKGPYFFH